MYYKVIKRHTITDSPCQIDGEHMTECGLVIPIRKLVDNYRKGKDIPRLSGNVNQSIPIPNKFGMDLIDFGKLNANFTSTINAIRKSIEQSQKEIPQA